MMPFSSLARIPYWMVTSVSSARGETLKKLCWAALGVVGVGIGLQLVFGGRKRRRNRKKVLRKQKEHAQTIKNMGDKVKELKLPTDEVERITSLSLPELIAHLQDGRLTAVDALHAYQAKAYEKNEVLNFITDPIVEAEAEAQALDSEVEKKPLHGVPVSIKDCYGLKGYDCSLGMANFLDCPWEEDSIVVKVLKHQGAVPFVKTNVPQTMLSYDCSNPVFGVTKNPQDVRRSPGGSSGGEGSCVGAGASAFGMGGDIGGSIRCPAAWCGICGFKPTTGRISTKGNFPIMAGMQLIPTSYGPFTRDVDSLVTILRALLIPRMFELDPSIPPIPFRQEMFEKKKRLRIGFYDNDGYCEPVPAVKRAVHVAKEALEKQGHELVPFTPHEAPTGILDCYVAGMFSGKIEDVREQIKDDQIDPSVNMIMKIMGLPGIIKTILSWLVKPLSSKVSQSIIKGKGVRSPTELFKLTQEVDKWRKDFYNHWCSCGLDAVICPASACTALTSGTPARCYAALSYCQLYNVTGYPAGIVPVTTVTKKDEEELKNYPVKEYWQRFMKKGCVDSEGLTVSVQVVSLPWQDEQCLQVMKDLETGVKLNQ